LSYKKISENIQDGILFARISPFEEYGILTEEEKEFQVAVYWNSREEAIRDLKAIIEFFEAGKK
jgi:hypothetical protein